MRCCRQLELCYRSDYSYLKLLVFLEKDLMKSLQLKVLSVVASALAVVGVAVAPQATAAERNLVAFGDSVLADPDAGSYFAHRYDPSKGCLLYTSPSPRDKRQSRMPSSA